MSLSGGDHQPSPIKVPSGLGEGDARRFPLVDLIAVNAHGVTFRSNCEFSIGSRLELGIHIRLRHLEDADAGAGEGASRFVPLSGYVVVSHLASHRGQPIYEVTLLFDEIAPGDAELLSRLPEASAARPAHGMIDASQGGSNPISAGGEAFENAKDGAQSNAKPGSRSVIGLN